ncbi:TPA: hypothetical protein LEQ12_002497 [Listeria monocytogenes]|uniref:hypothetical protein n=1 Tax=Listeria monocytogenes TaxID=1639 RepID=UPI0015E74336|nr:hypothetical protein [Listeria monocytogenes]EKZ4054053.1 hypothetical protein [Listeria monocytogenes]HBJ8559595.1 hypothetical protein [Listeria monocytogenes]HBJ9359687.1 hypothetical protein [Listeria monocytogenes]HBJ9835097.1 hypothetical protein [Listeria monocytogenes]HBK0228580.1 hypothetical protein [Listeria monocytogenes]
MSILVKLFIESILDISSERTINDVPKSLRAKVQAGLDEYYASTTEEQVNESAR